MEIVFSNDILWLFFGIAILAGIIDTIAGGGGLIVLPALLLAQVPPINALAINKLQGSFGTLTSSLTLLAKGAVNWHNIRHAFFASIIGSAIGTAAVHFIDTSLLEWCIPLVLMTIAGYFLLSKPIEETQEKPLSRPISDKKFLYGVIPSIGFYDGFLGPGTGSFFSAANMICKGQTIITATANAKWLNFGSNIASLAIFIGSGNILWLIGGVMILGQIIGASIGSRLVLSQGNTIIRPLIIIVCVSMCIYFIAKKIL